MPAPGSLSSPMSPFGKDFSRGDESMIPSNAASPSKFRLACMENFLKAQVIISAYDFEIGILAYYNADGMLAVVNLFTMVRRFL